MKFESSLRLRLIYVFRINDAEHEGCLKVGETTCDSSDILSLVPNCKALNSSARARINQYTQTAGIKYELLHTELTLFSRNKALCSFNDKEVHEVLRRSGVEKKAFDTEGKANEWFITDLETVKRAISAAKEGRQSLNAAEVTQGLSPVIFRPEQQEAIEKTKKQFRKGNQMLWNAKMRFGKTLSALQVVRDMNFCRTLILTHRPVVNSGWFEDFGKIFYDKADFAYGSKDNGDTHTSLEARAKQGKCRYVYFASMQDLRGSEQVGGNFDKNKEIFATKWDCLIVDEAHEGTQTSLGKSVVQELLKPKTKILRLSGTPFNLLDSFKEDEIYTWDYVMEQQAKADWDKLHWGDPNPYASLPKMNIYTYNLGKLLHGFEDEDIAFNFREFFRTNDAGDFIHEKDVWAFLNLLTKEDEDSNYPFANDSYRDIFRHTLWTLPGVREARALSALLKKHSVFQHFEVVNVAGEGDADEENGEALAMVNAAIGDDPDATRTITLTCGRLTTGVSVKAWTGVFMLSGSYNTAASAYMQTIFRVQTPATINGRVKEQCYVFDFAPDRTLKVIAEAAKVSAKAGKTKESDRKIMGDFLNFCPIISVEGSTMVEYDTPRMLEQLKKAYVERIVRSGFDDTSLYNDNLLSLDYDELERLDNLSKVIGKTKAMPKTGQIDINNQGLTNEQYKELQELEKKRKKKDKLALTEEEQRRLKELRDKQKNREAAISILRSISIRMPLLIYGATLENEETPITLDSFVRLVDEKSWEEFMPKGVTQAIFNDLKKYYDEEIFQAAGRRIRDMARAADKLSIEERIERIAHIFASFRNPDKETVLTPWRVVNMHMGDCVGGYNFYDDPYERQLIRPRLISQGDVTQNTFCSNARILEINSKSGLYPLYMAYSIYRTKVDAMSESISLAEQLTVWDKVVRENIFVICNTEMAKSITKRTLVGFRDAKTNVRHFKNLVNQIQEKPQNFIRKIPHGKNYWKSNANDNMKFNAIVGNPPYQKNDGSGASDDAANPIYHSFVRIAKMLKPDYVSLIMPSRWMIGGKRILEPFRREMMEDKCLARMHDYEDSGVCFATQHIDGGICYFLWDKAHSGKCNYTFHPENGVPVTSNRFLADGGADVVIRDTRRQPIIEKVTQGSRLFKDLVSNTQPFGVRKDLFNSPQNYPDSNLREECFDGSVRIYGVKGIKGGAKRKTGYVSPVIITRNVDSLPQHKLFFTTSFSTNAINPPDTIIGEPNDACTETFLMVGPFDTKEEQLNCNKYISTRFFKVLLFFGRGSMQVSQSVFRFIPLQDFTSNSDINWSSSVAEIDCQLYKKYGLSESDIVYINNFFVKP